MAKGDLHVVISSDDLDRGAGYRLRPTFEAQRNATTGEATDRDRSRALKQTASSLPSSSLHNLYQRLLANVADAGGDDHAAYKGLRARAPSLW